MGGDVDHVCMGANEYFGQLWSGGAGGGLIGGGEGSRTEGGLREDGETLSWRRFLADVQTDRKTSVSETTLPLVLQGAEGLFNCYVIANPIPLSNHREVLLSRGVPLPLKPRRSPKG